MNKKLIFALLFSSALFISCKEELKVQEDSEMPATVVSDAENPSMASPTVAPAVASQQATQQPTTVAPGMNPAHGQPNHRCDIEVGAPLNSPAKQASTQPAAMPTQNITTTPAPAPTPVSSQPVATAPGMNPPHGQAGHLCEIAVGAPLPK